MKRLYQTCISALIFLIPSNLFYVLSEYGSRIHGLQIDYLLPKLHASDLCIAALVCLWLFEHRKQSIVPFFKDFFTSKKAVVLLVLVVGITARQLSTTHPLQAVFAFVSWTKLALLGYILWQKRAVVHSLATYATLAVTVLFQSLVAVWQFSTQQSIAGYWFLGETNLSSFAGLAKTAWGGAEQVLPYGTTAHPNVLAGFLALSSGVLLWRTLNSKFSTHQRYAAYAVVIFASFVVVLTQSLSASLTLLLLLIFTLLKHLQHKTSVQAFAAGILLVSAVCSLLLWVVPLEYPSLTRRVYLTKAALAMSAEHPLFGVGLQGFTTQVERYAPTKEVVRFVQPVHNTILLVLTETGLLGILAVLTALTLATPNTRKNLLYAAALTNPILFLDHYVYTLQTGQLTLLFFIFWVTLAGSPQEPSSRLL